MTIVFQSVWLVCYTTFLAKNDMFNHRHLQFISHTLKHGDQLQLKLVKMIRKLL